MAKKRKTREQKIIAELRRELEATRRGEEKGWVMSSVSSSENEGEDKESKITLTHITHSRPTTHNTPPPPIPSSYLKKDLTKTILLAILAISLELVIYFFLG